MCCPHGRWALGWPSSSPSVLQVTKQLPAPWGEPWKAGLWHAGHSAYLWNCNCLFPPFSSLVAKKLSTFDYMTQGRQQQTPQASAEKEELSFQIRYPQVPGVPLFHHSYYLGLGQCQGSPCSWDFSTTILCFCVCLYM